MRSDAGRRGPAMEALFGLYDALEASAQEGLAAPPDGADAAAVAAAGVQLLEELRTRLTRLVRPPCSPSQVFCRVEGPLWMSVGACA